MPSLGPAPADGKLPACPSPAAVGQIMGAQLKSGGLTSSGLECDYEEAQVDGIANSPVGVEITTSAGEPLTYYPIDKGEAIAKSLADQFPDQWGFRTIPQFGAHAHEWWELDHPTGPSAGLHIDCSLEVPAPDSQYWDIKVGDLYVPVQTTCSQVEQLLELLRP